MRKLTALFMSGVVSLALVAGVAGAHTQLQPGFNLFSTSQDAEIGRQSAATLERRLPMLSTPAATRLVTRVGQRLAANAGGPGFSYRFKVVNLSDVNAFALPGGYVYIHRGLIERVRTEGELAGVMAHEIAHIALRHPTHQLSKAYVAQTGAGLLTRVLGGGSSQGRTSQIVNAVGGFGLNTLFLKFSRSAEEEADALGARIMARSGYDAAEMANFFALLRKQSGTEPSRVAVFLSSHPAPSSRESHIRTEARQLGYSRRAPVGGLGTAQTELRRLAPARKLSQVARAT
jgi:predicted Zn-dependent protease